MVLHSGNTGSSNTPAKEAFVSLSAKPKTRRLRCYCMLFVFIVSLFVLITTDTLVSQMVAPQIKGFFMQKMYAGNPAESYYIPPQYTVIPLNDTLDRNSTSSIVSQVAGVDTSSIVSQVAGVDLGPPYKGGEYLTNPSKPMTKEFRQRLKDKYGLEPAEDHAFKSPFINTPEVYPVDRIQQPGDTSIKTKIVSIFNVPKWFRGLKKYIDLNDRNVKNFTACPYNHCIMDMDGKRSKEADMLIFFVGYLGSKTPPPRPPGQLWVKAFWEAPVHYGYPKNYGPWKSAFNLTYNYRVDSDIFAPNNQLGWRHRDSLLSDAEYLRITHQKKKAVAWFVSNCKTNGKRQEYVKQLQKYIPVDIYGKCGPLKCNKFKPEECKTLLTTTYFFYLSFENSLCKDYISEKLFSHYQRRTHVIPVTRGGADYDKYFPPGGFINAGNFPTTRDLGLFLKDLMNDEKRYARMLREKDRLKTLDYKVDFCQVCEKLHTNGYPPKVIPDIKEWSHKNACQQPNDIR